MMSGYQEFFEQCGLTLCPQGIDIGGREVVLNFGNRLLAGNAYNAAESRGH
jgi:hypothetical protein